MIKSQIPMTNLVIGIWDLGFGHWLLVLGYFFLALSLLLIPRSLAHSQAPGPPPAERILPTPTPTLDLPFPPEVARTIEPELLKAALKSREGTLRYIIYLHEQSRLDDIPRHFEVQAQRQAIVARLQDKAQTTQASLRAELAARQAKGQVRKFTPFWIVNAIAVESDGDTLLSIARRSEVGMVRLDRKRELLINAQIPMTKSRLPMIDLGFGHWDLGIDAVEWNIARIGADKVWHALGVDGKGAVVASMDTGVDWRHPALETRYRGYNPKGLPQHRGNWASTTDEEYIYPGDGNGHGTHTTGIMVGEGGIGVAPGAQWIAVKVFHDQGHTFDSWLHAGFQWLLAPDGDPSLAPDVVNASWGSEISTEDIFRPDLAALRAAQIVPVFAAGNHGSKPASITSPGSLAEAFAVGATDAQNDIATFSGRGPSPWGEIKPEVVAPGVGVRSSMHGGGYVTWNGTSMAAPQVAGLVALLRQVNPRLTVTATEQIITSTAVPLGSPSPNNSAGWGLIDAYRAVATVVQAGQLTGRVTRTSDSRPLPGATILASEPDGPATPLGMTDPAGYFTITLRAGTYDVTARAFAFAPRTVTRVKITAGDMRRLDFALDLAPVGVLFGRVTDQSGSIPLAAQVVVLGTPIEIATDPLTGAYSTFLPPGDYQVEVRSPAHRVGRAAVSIVQDQGRKLDFALPTAPRILVVDSGAWYYRSQLPYFEQALSDLGYLYEVWRIKDSKTGAPQMADLRPYDLTIWSSPLDSPGLVGAVGTITRYLSAGGRLFLTGQDIGYWDGGGSGGVASYFQNYLRARFVKDDAGVRRVLGTENDVFSDLDLKLEGRGGADNQAAPDVIAPLDPTQAVSVFQYPMVGSAGLRVGVCRPYRAVYLAFGLEGVDSRSTRANVLGRAIDWLTAQPPAADFDLYPSDSFLPSGQAPMAVAAPGRSVTYTLTLRNLGRQADTYTLSARSSHWPASLWTADFQQPLTDTLTLSSCTTSPVGVRVDVPVEATWNISHTTWLTATSRLLVSSSTSTASRAVRVITKTPAPILLVDDDRWYNVEQYYQAALDSLGYAYDTWTVGWNPGEAAGSPSLERLAMYPMVFWFTGYDWYQTLVPGEEDSLARYLDTGGRLFLSSQDYLYTAGLTRFGINYLGVLTYTEDFSSTVVTGVPDNPITRGLGPYSLTLPFDALGNSANHSDGLTAQPAAQAAFVGQDGQVAGVTLDGPAHAFRTAFFAFPYEALPATGATEVASRLIAWLSPLGTSSLAVDLTNAAGGQNLTYTVIVRNDGAWPARQLHLVNSLPPGTTYITRSLIGGATFDLVRNQIIWEGDLPPHQALSITYQVALPRVVAPGTQIVNQLILEDSMHIPITRTVITRVNTPDLSTSTLWVNRSSAQPGDVLDYLVILRNAGTLDDGFVVLTNTLPAGTVLVPGSLYASSGHVELRNDRIVFWGGDVPRQPAQVAISYQLQIRRDFPGGYLENNAQVNDTFGNRYELRNRVLVPVRVYLPLMR